LKALSLRRLSSPLPVSSSGSPMRSPNAAAPSNDGEALPFVCPLRIPAARILNLSGQGFKPYPKAPTPWTNKLPFSLF
jgi:hypothetical protein